MKPVKDMSVEELELESAQILVDLYNKRNDPPKSIDKDRKRWQSIHDELERRDKLSKITTGHGIFGWFRRFF